MVNNAILLINRFRLQVREEVEDLGLVGQGVPAKRRLGGFDLWRLEAAQRYALLRQAIVDGTRPSRAAWVLKERILPPIYWKAMLKGREWMAKPLPPKVPAD